MEWLATGDNGLAAIPPDETRFKIMEILIGAALAIFSVVIVVYPFFKSRSLRRIEPTGQVAATPTVDLESTYDTIRTLQLEYQLGKVSEESYQEQFRDYRIQAATILRDLDQVENAERALEEEILSTRASLYGVSGTVATCPNCGTEVGVGDIRCAECDRSLTPADFAKAQTSEASGQ